VRILFDNATDNLSTAFVETGLAASETRPNRYTHQPLAATAEVRTRAAQGALEPFDRPEEVPLADGHAA
jgi:hypothetical protein